MKTAVIYARYSSDSQSEQSIEGQLRVCEEYAKSKDLVILNTYIDRAMTGTNDNRAAFQQMIKDSSQREWNYVIVYKLDRFSRNKYEMAIHRKTLTDNKVKLLSATEHIPDTPEGIIFESMLEGYAAYYSAELSQKVKRGMNETRRKGNYTGGNILYGYKIEDKKVVINKPQAEIIRHIYEQYSIGVYVKDIIRGLSMQGIFNRGKPFARNTMYNILKNEKYSGIYKYNGELFDNIYPQIVPPDIYQKVRKRIDDNKYGKRSTEVVYLFRNKMACGYCGKPISAECGTSSPGKVIRYYKCSGRRHRNGCQKSAVRKDIFEEFVLDIILRELNSPDNMDSLIAGLMKIQQEQLKADSVLKVLSQEKRHITNSIDNLMSAIEKGVVTDTTTKRLKELEVKSEELERKIILERSKTSVKLTEADIRQFYEEALTLEPKLLIDVLIKQIVLYEDKVEIYCNNPLPTSPDESRGFIFYSGTSHIPYVIQNKPELASKEMSITIAV